MYRLLIIKRIVEDIIIFPFIVFGRLVALLYPLKKQYRIFFLFPFYHTGGAEKVHAQIAAATGGADCIVYFSRRSADDRFLDDFRKSGCVIKDISKFTDNKWLYFLNLIYRGIITGHINSQKISPVVFNGQSNFGYKISPWIRKSIQQIELIHSFNTFSYIRIPFLPFISKTVMISQKRIDDHKLLYDHYKIPSGFIERIKYIPNAISMPKRVTPKSDDNFTVLYVGRGTEEKRVRLIAEIALQLKNENIQFEMMGDVSEAVTESEFPFIKFYGNISDEKDISSIYANAHVVILTSITEGFPMVIIEAMAHGCAILSTAVGDIPYHVKSNENGFLFSNTKDEASIIKDAVEKIVWLKNNRDGLKKIADNNINYANHNFDIERFDKDYRELLSSVKEVKN